MKKFLLSFSYFFISISLFAQDPLVQSAILNPAAPIVSSGGVGTFTFQSLSGGDIPLSQELKITISYTNLAPSGPPTGAVASLFDWVINGAGTAYQGTQNAIIFEGTAGDLQSTYTVTGAIGVTAAFAANIGNTAGLNGNGTTNDNTGTSGVIVQEPLPVKLIAFSGKAENCETINLNWSTAQEYLNKGFEIQKMDHNNRFETIAFVEGVGEANYVNNYQHSVRLENNEFGKQLIFRLKQIDYSGVFDYSSAISVGNICTKEIDFEIFPNPAIDQVNVVLMSDVKGMHKVSLFNEFQQFVKEFEIYANEANSFEMSDLAPGVYFFRIANNNEFIIKRVVKVKR